MLNICICIQLSVFLLSTGMAVDASDTEFEVLRKDRCGDKERDFLSELRNGGHPAGALPIHHPHLTIGPGELQASAGHGYMENLSASDIHTKRSYFKLNLAVSFLLPVLGDLSMEVIQSLLLTAWLALQHFPPPTLYPRLCALLALSMGQQDPVTTAMLHAQSLGVTSRQHMIRHLANRLK